ncbi:uncharacterized protein ASCRUDRAFT_75057 [Ascoidea rubescens DSM 1968]|uniref:Uncharacterized protein n=1 Tax=Ascoidea rubescens DSM 1968 TaxID=1344418 RepID=A0A1D2VJH4_9ASCO|nr:hypothetical protein ASCRUDRAFT_75057 [Ascoidea rubescens DSM 1968]ODV61771.1 hypothetical protein ASCRUDRAFT_75057 [Ascoidea rubescens DSM 1968]
MNNYLNNNNNNKNNSNIDINNFSNKSSCNEYTNLQKFQSMKSFNEELSESLSASLLVSHQHRSQKSQQQILLNQNSHSRQNSFGRSPSPTNHNMSVSPNYYPPISSKLSTTYNNPLNNTNNNNINNNNINNNGFNNYFISNNKHNFMSNDNLSLGQNNSNSPSNNGPLYNNISNNNFQYYNNSNSSGLNFNFYNNLNNLNNLNHDNLSNNNLNMVRNFSIRSNRSSNNNLTNLNNPNLNFNLKDGYGSSVFPKKATLKNFSCNNNSYNQLNEIIDRIGNNQYINSPAPLLSMPGHSFPTNTIETTNAYAKIEPAPQKLSRFSHNLQNDVKVIDEGNEYNSDDFVDSSDEI